MIDSDEMLSDDELDKVKEAAEEPEPDLDKMLFDVFKPLQYSTEAINYEYLKGLLKAIIQRLK